MPDCFYALVDKLHHKRHAIFITLKKKQPSCKKHYDRRDSAKSLNFEITEIINNPGIFFSIKTTLPAWSQAGLCDFRRNFLAEKVADTSHESL